MNGGAEASPRRRKQSNDRISGDSGERPHAQARTKRNGEGGFTSGALI